MLYELGSIVFTLPFFFYAINIDSSQSTSFASLVQRSLSRPVIIKHNSSKNVQAALLAISALVVCLAIGVEYLRQLILSAEHRCGITMILLGTLDFC